MFLNNRNSKRIASLRVGDTFGDSTPALKYNLDSLSRNLGNHLGSSNVLVDEYGTLVNFEEYYPFGETSFGSYAKKRYRFCGKEKDDESGMYYYGARYYSPWLCRFVSVDPKAGKYVFQTPFAYADNNPINKMDFNGEGTEGDPSGKSDNINSAPTPVQFNNVHTDEVKTLEAQLKFSSTIKTDTLAKIEELKSQLIQNPKDKELKGLLKHNEKQLKNAEASIKQTTTSLNLAKENEAKVNDMIATFVKVSNNGLTLTDKSSNFSLGNSGQKIDVMQKLSDYAISKGVSIKINVGINDYMGINEGKTSFIPSQKGTPTITDGIMEFNVKISGTQIPISNEGYMTFANEMGDILFDSVYGESGMALDERRYLKDHGVISDPLTEKGEAFYRGLTSTQFSSHIETIFRNAYFKK